MTTTEQTESARILADMRRLVSWLEAHPDIEPIDMEAGSIRQLPQIHLRYHDFAIVASGKDVERIAYCGSILSYITIDGINFVACEQTTVTP